MLPATVISTVANSSLCWSCECRSCSKSAEARRIMPSVPITATFVSPCLRQPRINAIKAHGRMKYISASWNSWLARNEYGAIINISGNKTQCIAQTDEIGFKIYKMLEKAFEKKPNVLKSGANNRYVFIVSKKNLNLTFNEINFFKISNEFS